MSELDSLLNTVSCMDGIELMKLLPDKSVDAFITDLPYGTTACSWDEIIPFAPMWAEVKRTLKPRGVFVTTASQPFTSKLVMSNLGMFKYSWVWDKVLAANIGTVKYMPLKTHEDVLVFANGSNNYFPELKPDGFKRFGKRVVSNADSRDQDFGTDYNDNVGYPKSILRFARPYNLTDGGLHPTQKPVALYEYLIRTYTQPNELVVDFCCGSGTTGLAAARLNRNYILCDITLEYVEVARKRLAEPRTISFLDGVHASCDTTDKALSSSPIYSPLPLFDIDETA